MFGARSVFGKCTVEGGIRETRNDHQFKTGTHHRLLPGRCYLSAVILCLEKQPRHSARRPSQARFQRWEKSSIIPLKLFSNPSPYPAVPFWESPLNKLLLPRQKIHPTYA